MLITMISYECRWGLIGFYPLMCSLSSKDNYQYLFDDLDLDELFTMT